MKNERTRESMERIKVREKKKAHIYYAKTLLLCGIVSIGIFY